MDLLHVITLSVALLLAIPCVVGIVRTWSKRGPAADREPLVHLTAAGWLLAGVTIAAVVAWLVVWAGPRGRLGRFWVHSFTGLGTGLGVLVFLAGRGVLAALGVKTTWEESRIATPPTEGEGPRPETGGLVRSRQRKREVDASLVGRNGVAITPLRPCGRVAVDGLEYEAVSEGTFVEAGAAIRVMRISRLTLQVRQEPA